MHTTFSSALKFHGAVDKCKESVVFADADVVTGMELGASLTNENVACENELTVRTFCTQSFCGALTTVVRRTGTFFMSE